MFYQDKIFSFNITSSCIGFSVFQEKEKGSLDIVTMGVRVFPTGREPQRGAGSATSLAASRTLKRSARRIRNRFLGRRNAALSYMRDMGIFPPKDEVSALLRETSDGKNNDKSSNVYGLRVRALHEKLPPYYIGRIFLHLMQRRGFKSGRKSENANNENGKIASGIQNLEKDLINEPYSQWLLERQKNNLPVRLRKDTSAYTDDAKAPYAFYVSRAIIEEEFDSIWKSQSAYYPDILTEDHRQNLRDIIFRQRPLKPSDCGVCLFYRNEPRLAKADPLFQELRIYQELNHLRICAFGESDGRALTIEERDKLADLLSKQKSVKFSKMKKSLGLLNNDSFNFETSREGFDGNLTACIMRSKKCFGSEWNNIPFKTQREVIVKLLDPILTDEALDKWLQENFKNLSEEQRKEIIDAPLPAGYGRIGETASLQILKELRHAVIPYSKAVELAGLEIKSEKENHDLLPKYQEIEAIYRQIIPGTGDTEDPYDKRMGRISNPTVHIALNQLRLVVNALLKKYGKPHKMIVAVGSDLKMNDAELREYNKTIFSNRKLNSEADEKAAELGIAPSVTTRAKYRLWAEMPEDKRICVYSGRKIALNSLLRGNDIEIGHILPLSQTLDDSMSNKILCYKSANKEKGNRAPADVFSWAQNYETLLERAQVLPEKKRWRFNRDAMTRFSDENKFLSRQLTDMQYITRISAQYLSSIYPAQEESYNKKTGELFSEFFSKKRVFPISKRIIGKISHICNLASLYQDEENIGKSQIDYRKYAIDAAIAGICTPDKLSKILKSVRNTEKSEADENSDYLSAIFSDILDWPHFCAEVKNSLNAIIVSHRPAHTVLSTSKDRRAGRDKTGGQLHKETVFGKEKLQASLKTLDLNIFDSLCDENLHERLVSFLRQKWKVYVEELTPKKFSKFWEVNFKEIWRDFCLQYPQYSELRQISYYGSSIIRKPFLELDLKSLSSIKDISLRKELQNFLSHELGVEITDEFSEEDLLPHEKKLIKTELGNALQKFRSEGGPHQGIRHVRLLDSAAAPIILRDKFGKPRGFVQGGNNFRADIWKTKFKDGSEKWETDIISMFDAAQPGKISALIRRPHPAAKKIMSLQKNDMVSYLDSETGQPIIARVVKFSKSGQIGFAPHNAAAPDSLTVITDVKKLMTEWKCRKISVSPIGAVIYPQDAYMPARELRIQK